MRIEDARRLDARSKVEGSFRGRVPHGRAVYASQRFLPGERSSKNGHPMTTHVPPHTIGLASDPGSASARPPITGGLLAAADALDLMNAWFFVSEINGEVSISRMEDDGSLTYFGLDCQIRSSKLAIGICPLASFGWLTTAVANARSSSNQEVPLRPMSIIYFESLR